MLLSAFFSLGFRTGCSEATTTAAKRIDMDEDSCENDPSTFSQVASRAQSLSLERPTHSSTSAHATPLPVYPTLHEHT